MARYKMRQRLLALGEDFTIEDEHGNPVYNVDGKLLRIRETFVIEDLSGNEIATIREKKLALRNSMNILRGGETIATIRKAWFSPFRTTFEVEVYGLGDLAVEGDILDHEYTISHSGGVVAAISKQWFSFSDTYGIEVAPGEDNGLMLAIVVAIDEMAHDPDEAQR